jgi:hypothetical protein
MLPSDWEEYLAKQEWLIKKPPVPTKRRQPKITRMQSRRQRIAESQTPNQIRAIYAPESKWNETPTMPEDWQGTHEVGPGDEHNNEHGYRAGKATVQPPVGYSKVEPRTGHRHGHTAQSKTLDELTAEYLLGDGDVNE